MNAIRLRQRIDCETLHIPQLKEMIGKTVEIIILEEVSAPLVLPETMETFLALAPKEAPLDSQQLEAMGRDPKYKKLWPLLQVAGQDFVDVNAIVELRAASLT